MKKDMIEVMTKEATKAGLLHLMTKITKEFRFRTPTSADAAQFAEYRRKLHEVAEYSEERIEALEEEEVFSYMLLARIYEICWKDKGDRIEGTNDIEGAFWEIAELVMHYQNGSLE